MILSSVHHLALQETPTMSLFLKNPLLSLLFLSLLIAATTSLPSTTIGVTYSTTTDPPPGHVAAALHPLHIGAVRLPDPTPSAVRAFSAFNASLLLTVPNRHIAAVAANRSGALLWLYAHVVPFHPRARISAISVGADAADFSDDLSDRLLPAVRNLHLALRDLGISKIAVSTTFSFVNIMAASFPPSAAEFQEPISGLIIKPLLQFLAETNSSFLINLSPHDVYRLNPEIPIGYALFQDHPFNFRDDPVTGVRYRNVFDMMVDAVIAAMAAAGHENIPVVVAETGWPSSGEDTGELYAGMYVKGLIRHLRSGAGTPLRKEGVAEAYVYELFDGDEKQGNQTGTSSNKWGILYPNMTKKFDFEFSVSAKIDEHLVKMAIGVLLIACVFLLE